MDESAQRRVLVVNDDRRLAESVRGLLEEGGYAVRTAFDGRHGLQVMAQWPPHLIVLDIIMPVLDGWGFLQQLQQRGLAERPRRDRPVVLVWSVLQAQDLERARLLGAAECLPRGSTSPDELLDAVGRLLHGAHAG
jgi:CheY-like chemotaxis protein